MQREAWIQYAVLEGGVPWYGGLAGELEEVHADEDGYEAHEEGYCVYGIVGVDALEEDEGGDDGGCREADIVERINSG